MYKSFVKVIILTIGMTLTIQGCVVSPEQSKNQVPGEARQMPRWAQSISEPIDLIPREGAEPVPKPISPTSVNQLHGLKARGVPRDLTAPIQSPTVARQDDLGSIAEPGGPGTNDSRPLTINIHTPASDNELPEGEKSPLQSIAPLEKMYRGDFDRRADRSLEQFGYRYFEHGNAKPAIGPVPNDYIVGPGDELIITVSGSFDEHVTLVVNREGQIILPEVGPVSVAQKRFDEMIDIISRAYAQTRKNFQVSISIGRMRVIQVHVVGEVANPGLVEVSAQATALDALAAAGGPKKTGSLRTIELRRKGDSVEQIDLYKFFALGEPASDHILQAGDVVHVPSIGPTIGIAGYVQRPGIYELYNPITTKQAIELAGGLTPFTFTPHAQIELTSDGRGRQTIDIELNEEGLVRPMSNGELLLIGAVDDRLQPVVQIEGQVVRPGAYQYRGGLRVRDIINLADGLTVDAFLPQAFVSRQVGEPGRMELIPDRKVVGTTRRVMVIDIAHALNGDPKHNIPLLPLDHITIRSRSESTVRPIVDVMGAVKTPGQYELTTGLRVSELIALAGNLTPNAYMDEAELIRRVHNPTTGQLDVTRYRFDLVNALTRHGEHNPVLQNGDRLIIRQMRQSEIKARIEGQVRFPGEYVFPAGTKISGLIAAAGGLDPDADLRAASFYRRSVQNLQHDKFAHLAERTQRVYEDALREMVQTGMAREGVAAKLALQDMEQLMGRMANRESTGRIVIPFYNEEFPNSDYDLALEEGDRLVIPRKQETVSVIGSVFTPNSFVAAEGLSVAEALKRAGGATEFADKEQVYVIRADGNVESMAQANGLQLSMQARLLPGDVVLVPTKAPERTAGARVSDILALLRQTAEVSVIAGQVGRDVGDFNLSSISNPPDTGDGINAYQEAILERTQR